MSNKRIRNVISIKTIVLTVFLLSFLTITLSVDLLSHQLMKRLQHSTFNHSLLRFNQTNPKNKTKNEIIIELRPKIQYLKVPRLLESKCWKKPCESNQEIKWKMIFVVKSAHNNIDKRELIRRTWGLLSYVNGVQFTTIFVVGKVEGNNKKLILDYEAERYGDILQINILDTYKNVSYKTLGGMQWVVENIPDDVFYTSCDDDVMFKMNELATTINQEIETVKKEELGDFPILCTYLTRRNVGPFRNDRSKYYTSRDDYKWKFFPDFCLGAAYSTSVGIIRHLWEISRKENRMKMDDVWITGVLRQKYGMPKQMVKDVKGNVAIHYEGFRRFRSDSRRDFMRKEWERYLSPLKDLVTCQCI